MFGFKKLEHQLEKDRLYQKTAEILGDEFVITYSLDNAESQDLFFKMFQSTVEQV